MRFLAFLLCLLPSLALAQPALDAITNTSQATSNSTTATVSAATSGPNEWVLVSVGLGGTTTSGVINLSASGCGLTWTSIGVRQGADSASHPVTVQTFEAFSAATLASCTVTLTASQNVDDWAIGQWALSGAVTTGTGLDSNQGAGANQLPQGPQTSTVGSCTSNTGISIYSTLQAHDFIFYVVGSNQGTQIGLSTACNGETKIFGNGIFNTGGIRYANVYVNYRRVTVVQSLTPTGCSSCQGAAGTGYVAYSQAFTSDSVAPATNFMHPPSP